MIEAYGKAPEVQRQKLLDAVMTRLNGVSRVRFEAYIVKEGSKSVVRGELNHSTHICPEWTVESYLFDQYKPKSVELIKIDRIKL